MQRRTFLQLAVGLSLLLPAGARQIAVMRNALAIHGVIVRDTQTGIWRDRQGRSLQPLTARKIRQLYMGR